MQTAIILAAGKGSKMWPYGETQPKACLPVATRPLIQHTVEALSQAGVSRFEVVVGHLENQVRSALRHVDGVRFHRQRELLGTAAALSLVLDTVDLAECLVVYGDVLVTLTDVAAVADVHRSTGAAATALVAEYGSERPADWIGAQVSGGRIQQILGHPRRETTHRVAGLFALDHKVWPHVHATAEAMTALLVGSMPHQEKELAQTLQDVIADGEDVRAVVAQSRTIDLDKPWHVLEANRAYLALASARLTRDHIPDSATVSEDADIRGRLVLGENAVVGPRVKAMGDLWVGENSVVDNGAILGPNCYIGANALVENYCHLSANTVVGDRSKVTHCAELSGIVMERVHLVHYMELEGVIGRFTDIGAATVCGTLRFDDAAATHRVKGRREVPASGANSTYIGDYCRTGVNVILMPGVKMGAYSIAGPGVLVQEDIQSRTAVFLQQSTATTSWGPERYGW